ncbi:MAG: hypothetical protein M1819_000031 [Sarea resinae]|nr:MAG: hypothetical protein M1819_000031 [Sarea resinae]
MTDSSASDTQESQKRSASAAGLNANSNNNRPVKRRASKACQCCRARKVRCNVVEHGAPCTNCRLDEVECVVTESKRRKKLWNRLGTGKPDPADEHAAIRSASVQRHDSLGLGDEASPISPARLAYDSEQDSVQHVPHLIYQTQDRRISMQDPTRQPSFAVPGVHAASPAASQASIFTNSPMFENTLLLRPSESLPKYIKPLPTTLALEDVEYLEKKGCVSIPELRLRNELLQSYVKFVHPYMPLLELNEFLRIIEQSDGSNGAISLLLFQAVMFAGTAFVDMEYLLSAGFTTRKAARKAFFHKARLLYDFDCEVDRISLVQALLLMTFWYETPDDQKDTWHWMGVAISLSHTIGLHRNPEKTNMDPNKQKLWKRVWWSCFMRDRLIALGMRRPTRIKDEDYDVPMLTLDDFELEPIPQHYSCISPECVLARDVQKRRQLAILCIEKAKLCLCVSQVLSAQYSVLNSNQGFTGEEGSNTRPTMMLIPKKADVESCDIGRCDQELESWLTELPEDARFHSTSLDRLSGGDDSLFVHRALLHMMYYTTLSALHRPQVLPSAPSTSGRAPRSKLHDGSRRKVRHAATEITRVAQELHRLDLVRYLPTTGVTVLLPAVIVHLLDIKSIHEATRRASLQGFCQCMQVLQKLRDNYAAADFSTLFLEAAIRKADIQLGPRSNAANKQPRAPNTETPMNPGGKEKLMRPPPSGAALTPPPEPQSLVPDVIENSQPEFSFPVFTPPNSESQGSENAYEQTPLSGMSEPEPIPFGTMDENNTSLASLMGFSNSASSHEFDNDFDSLINLDQTSGDSLTFGGAPVSMHGESSGFTLDMDWMTDMKPTADPSNCFNTPAFQMDDGLIL